MTREEAIDLLDNLDGMIEDSQITIMTRPLKWQLKR